ncbi:MAG TPA: response regulator transcription factor [bacterium]|jgi:two-component system phosphate regulon response regulator PhoB
MAKARILVVEDEEDILELVRFNLAKDGFRVEGLASGEEGLRAVRSQPPDLLILDLMLPGMDGLEVCRRLRADEATRQVPIVMLTAKGEEADIVTGLELGADDYIPKPFSPRVLTARVKAVLRRREQGLAPEGQSVRAHEIEIRPGRREVIVAGRPVALTFTEFNILHFLARRPGWVFTRGQIMDAARGEDYHVTERSVDVQMVSLRKKLGEAGRHIQTVRGVGYRLAE